MEQENQNNGTNASPVVEPQIVAPPAGAGVQPTAAQPTYAAQPPKKGNGLKIALITCGLLLLCPLILCGLIFAIPSNRKAFVDVFQEGLNSSSTTGTGTPERVTPTPTDADYLDQED